MQDMGEDWNYIENMVKDRKAWKTKINRRMRFIMDWEEKLAYTRRTETKPVRSQRRNDEELKCRWAGCETICCTKGGLTQHERHMHRARDRVKLVCEVFCRNFDEKNNLTNHQKSCRGGG